MNAEVKGQRRISITHSYIVAGMLLAAYVAIYQFSPFEETLSYAILQAVTILAAAFAASIATLVFFQYDKDDMPRIVWKYMMAACWLWFLGEVAWGYYAVMLGEVPVGITDVSWVIGFIFFTLALYQQYSLIEPSKKSFYRHAAIAVWIVVLLIPLAIAYFINSMTPKTYMDFFYPFADLAVGIAGVLLIFTFQGGDLMRPWIGLVVFGITDFLYAWAEQTGVYAWSSENSNLLTLSIDTSYLAAYLILALGFIGHWILLHYGVQEIHE